MQYVIRNKHNDQLFWSNKYGWVDASTEDRFTVQERHTLNLPIDGQWCVVMEKSR